MIHQTDFTLTLFLNFDIFIFYRKLRNENGIIEVGYRFILRNFHDLLLESNKNFNIWFKLCQKARYFSLILLANSQFLAWIKISFFKEYFEEKFFKLLASLFILSNSVMKLFKSVIITSSSSNSLLSLKRFSKWVRKLFNWA